MSGTHLLSGVVQYQNGEHEKTPKQNLENDENLKPTPSFINGSDPTVSMGFLINTCVGILLGFQTTYDRFLLEVR